MLTALVLSIGETGLAAFMRQSTFAYPLVSSLHIVGLGLLIGCILSLDLRLLGLFQRVSIHSLAPFLSRLAGLGLCVAILTGVILFSVQPGHYLQNDAFLFKMALIGAGLLNVIVVHQLTAWRMILSGNEPSHVIKITALLSLIFWLAVVFAGRWIAFV